MSNRTKSYIAMVVMLVAAMLTGCQGTSHNSSTSAEGDVSSTSQDKAITCPYTGDPIVYRGYAYEGLDQNPELLCQKAWKEHIGNISIEYEFAAYNDYLEKSKVYLATNDIPDVMPMPGVMSVASQYGSTGCLLDFNKYSEYMPNLQEYRKQYPNLDYVCNSKNERFAIVGVQPIDFAGESYWVNMDVLNAAGQKVPETFEEMLSTMRSVKANDPTIIPWQSYWNIDYTQGWFAKMMGAKYDANTIIYYDTADSTYKCVYREASAKRRELIEMMATLYREGLINSEIAEMSFEQEQNAIATGKWAFSATYNNSPEVEIFKVEKGAELPYDIQPMTAPADSDGNRYLPIAYQHDGLPGWGIVCSSKVEHPELLAAYMDQVVSPFGRDIFNYGVEGTTFDYVDVVPTIRDGIDKAEYGIGTQYEVWMVGMGPVVRTADGYNLASATLDNNMNNFMDGTVKADFSPQFTVFGSDEATEKANLENNIMTFVKEQEAKFIYGQRNMDEWDAYVQELESFASIDDLITLYGEAQTIERDPERIFAVK